MNNVIIYTDYRSYKTELDTELQKSAESFVRIGYLLKVARDTNILKESGYSNVNDFAKEEYGLDKTMVSRFININDRFSEDGYSENLKAEYRGYGYAKLAIMLLLPDEVNELLTAGYSKAEIRMIKDEVDAEKKITDIEVMLEEKDGVQQAMDGNLKKTLFQLGKDNPALYAELHAAMQTERMELIKEVLAPDGNKIYSIRIRGTGRMMLAVKSTGLSLRDIRNSGREEYDWEQALAVLQEVIHPEMDQEESWEETYQEEYPKKEKQEVAPVQPQREQRKQPKVEKAKVPEKKAPERTAEEQVDISIPEEYKEPEVQQGEKHTGGQLYEENMEPDTSADQSGRMENEPVMQQEPKGTKENEEAIEPDREDSGEPDQTEECSGQIGIEEYPEYMPEPVPDTRESEEQLQEEALELADIYIAGNLRDWTGMGMQMPLEEIEACILNTEKLSNKLRLLREAARKREEREA